MIAEISSQEVVLYCRSVLGIKAEGATIGDDLLTAILRRTAGILCPCSRITLRSALIESLAYLYGLQDELSQRIDELTDGLIVAGDLLELSDVATGDNDVKRTWVFLAPPSFVVRKGGNIFLTGIAPDNDRFLPDALKTRVEHHCNTRSIATESDEDLVEILVSEGLNRLSESAWLKAPKKKSPTELLAKHIQRLATEPFCGPIAGLEIIDSATNSTYYRGRWTSPKNQTGTFVARRPQEFGAAIWCLVELSNGTPIRIIDLPIGVYRWRGCDAAWHLQMAIDWENGRPQRYRVTSAGDFCRFDFWSPLPLWSERRLMVLGHKCRGGQSLFGYEIPANESEEEEEFLKETLWLLPFDNANDGRRA